jgi:hypothetical protein
MVELLSSLDADRVWCSECDMSKTRHETSGRLSQHNEHRPDHTTATNDRSPSITVGSCPTAKPELLIRTYHLIR